VKYLGIISVLARNRITFGSTLSRRASVMLTQVGITICTGRRMQVGRVPAAYVSTNHQPRDYLDTLCLSRPGFFFTPPKCFFAFNLSRTSCLVSVTNHHLRLQISPGWRSRYLRVCFGAASATSRLPNVSVFAVLLQLCDNDYWTDRFSKNHH